MQKWLSVLTPQEKQYYYHYQYCQAKNKNDLPLMNYYLTILEELKEISQKNHMNLYNRTQEGSHESISSR